MNDLQRVRDALLPYRPARLFDKFKIIWIYADRILFGNFAHLFFVYFYEFTERLGVSNSLGKYLLPFFHKVS